MTRQFRHATVRYKAAPYSMSTVLSMGHRAVVQQPHLPDYANSSSKCRFNCCEEAETVLCFSQDGVLLNKI
jgi:hypothetical protein